MIFSLEREPSKILCNILRSTELCALSAYNLDFTSITKNHIHYHALRAQSSHGDVSQQQRLLNLLQTSSKVHSLDTIKSFQALTITMGLHWSQPIFIFNRIISWYISVSELSMARNVFDRMTQRSIVSYNTIISGYSRYGNGKDAWELFCEMRALGFVPSEFTFGGLLSNSQMELKKGFQLQGLTLKSGLLHSNAILGTALIGLFGRVCCLDEAIRIFEDMPLKNLVTWNSIITLFANNGLSVESMSFFGEIMRVQIGLSELTFVGVLSGFQCAKDLELGQQIHGLVIKTGFDYEIMLVNCLVNMYAKCLPTCSVEKVFKKFPIHDVVTWNIVIGALGSCGRPTKALEIFFSMSDNGILPNMTTFVSVLTACISLKTLLYGEFIHAKVVRNGFATDVVIGSSLVDFYAKCNELEDAHLCFNEINEKNIISWNALILGYSKRCSSTSISLLKQMMKLGYYPDEFSFSSVLKSVFVSELKQLHCSVIKMGYDQNDYVSSSLMTSYARNGQANEALTFIMVSSSPLPVVLSNIMAGMFNRNGQYHETQKLLLSIDEPDVVSWNILIASCSRTGNFAEVFELFKQMRVNQIRFDSYTFVSLLSACTKLCNLALGSSVHGLIIKSNFNSYDTFVCNLLIDMYGKCGNIGGSVEIFETTMNRNLITWTALISSLGVNGYANEALQCFKEMEFLGFKPDPIAFLSVLSACRHGGLVEEGKDFFGRMKRKYGIEPEMDHYNCLVDLLAKNGHLKEAEELMCGMPFQPNAATWRSFVEGCRKRAEEHEEGDRCSNC